jgi:hypothetical protein
MLIDFTDAEESQCWMAINDDVMGGISQSCIELSPKLQRQACARRSCFTSGT